MRHASASGPRRRRVLVAAAGLLAVLGAMAPVTASGKPPPQHEPRSPGQELHRMLSCEWLAGRCVGMRPLLPADPRTSREAGPAAPVDPPDVGGAICPGTKLAAPVQDDWCERWVTKRELGPMGSGEAPYAVTPSPDGSELYVLAYYATLDGFGAALLVFDAANGVWRRTMPIPYRFLGPDSEFFPYLLAADDDTLFVSGYVKVREEAPEGFARHVNFLTAAYSRTGELRWSSRYGGPMSGKGPAHGDWPVNLMLSPDGSQLIVAGVSTVAGDFERDVFNREVAPDEVATLSYDAATGTERWVEQFDSGKREFPWGLAVSPDGTALYVNTMSTKFESTLLAYDGLTDPDDGPELRWSHSEDRAGFIGAIAIGVTRDGPVLAGLSNPDTSVDYGVVALDTEGNVRWRANHSNVYTTIAGAEETSWDIPMGMVADGERVYVTGYAYEWDLLTKLGDPSPSMVGSTVAFDAATGKLGWEDTYSFAGHRIHFPMSIHLAGDRIYVPGVDSECNFYMGPGYYCQSSTINLVTLDYDAATGSLQRVARFNNGRSVALPDPQPSLPTAPGYNHFARSVVGPGRQLSVVTQFDFPCAGCHPAAWWRMGIVAYGPAEG